MYTIQIGSFMLNGQIILLFAYGWFGWVAMRRYLRKLSVEEDYGTIAFNAFMIWFLVWKGSPLLFDPLQTIKHPTSLLYFDGGVLGQWIASITSGLYVAYRVWKGKMSWKMVLEAATVFLLGGKAILYIGYLWFESDNWLFHAGYTVLALITLLSFFYTKQLITIRALLQRWQWFSIALTILWFLNPERELVILSFSSQQIVSFTTGMILSIYFWFYHGKQTNGQRGNH